ncbi:hypothetical protein ZORO111902_17255 [Zobellia roscoffensis]
MRIEINRLERNYFINHFIGKPKNESYSHIK